MYVTHKTIKDINCYHKTGELKYNVTNKTAKETQIYHKTVRETTCYHKRVKET